ncbi:DUF3526 domain-containing protein [Desertivirga brevis]|uniref:DUF3526 domain-containing protein n=1 Tax=Desertivirga brevis TaxID=2810310 RepID=UPI001A973CF3|nr:DUF3526 domain-containing protein [Pedobacter sp. SYSU D00873]
MISHILKYEWLSFKRQGFNLVIHSLAILLGLYSIYYGAREIKKQELAIASVMEESSRSQKLIQEGFSADTSTTEGKKAWEISAVASYAWHRHVYPAAYKPSPLASLAIGQRDLQPYYYKISAMSLYYQVFQNEIANPEKLLAGNFDLSFVLVYLFPLLIIAFSYNILSEDTDRGVLPVIRSQAFPVKTVVLYRLLFYFILLTGTAFLLSMVGFISDSSMNFDRLNLAVFWLIIILIYFLFWFSLMFILISLKKNTGWNAMAGIGTWLLILILIPALLNILISLSMPLNSSVLSSISRRAGVFDEEKDENHIKVIQEFLTKHPEFAAGPQLFQKKLMAKGQAAFTVLRDAQSARLVATYQNQVKERDKIARSFNFINPAVATQNLFNSLASTDLYAFQDFSKSVAAFHKQLVTFYYSRLFSDRNFSSEEMRHSPVFVMSGNFNTAAYIRTGVFQLLMLTVLLLVIGAFISSKNLK